jgi:hypothetical protein
LSWNIPQWCETAWKNSSQRMRNTILARPSRMNSFWVSFCL